MPIKKKFEKEIDPSSNDKTSTEESISSEYDEDSESIYSRHNPLSKTLYEPSRFGTNLSDTHDESHRINSRGTHDESSSDDEEIHKKITKKQISVKKSNKIFKELIKNQLHDVPSQWKLNVNDIKRICKYINNSIFDEDECCIWNGYITNINNINKGTYINFYFKNKKVALHRLLYSNFVAPLDSSEYLKFNCENKGICCNVNHYEKYKYSKNNIIIKEKKKDTKPENKKVFKIGNDDSDDLTIDFD